MRYKAVILDVDGTIIAPGVTGVGTLSPRLIRSVCAVQDGGIWVSLATARSLDWVQDLVQALRIRAPIILDNGARIWDCEKQQYIWETYIQKETAQRVLSFLGAFSHQIHLVDNDIRALYDPAHPPSLEKVAKIMVLHIVPFQTHLLWEKLQKFSDIQITKSVSGEGVESVHVTAKDATKDNALERMTKFLNIEPGECIGIGDSYNDVGFMKRCGLKIAMGNAVEEVKEIADLVIDAQSDDGVAKFLETQFLQKEVSA